MLKLEHIIKNYEMKGAEVKALKDISICFRKNEFVSILGPSGCGKTTLLNILGGLDHYTSGNLIIDGKSTKNFNDRDWDVYRNHRIGFIFQSYNLIPQENILENVELALTIGGISKEEREERAKNALDRVGLKDLYKKKPNQLSGGQCQRVAIARALVNEPEILLADEPTGALDSKTSVQIMDLIKEISKERLVIMVTHNPELAEKYSSRIISLLDGQVVNDTNPYTEEEEEKERENEPTYQAKEKAKMSWLTAFTLSAKNLWVKAKRTAMIIVAASIGIIGVSAVLSVSGGVTGYINSMQDEMLSGNPVTVDKEGYDLSKLMSGTSFSTQSSTVKEGIKDGYVNVDFMVESLINSAKQMGSMMISNDITEDYVNYVKQMPRDYYEDISYRYGINVSNNIYTSDDINGYDSGTNFSLSAILSIASSILGKTDYSSYSSIISSMGSSFSQSLSNTDYLLNQYDIVEGKVATEEDEIMIVLSKDENITDFLLTLLGYYSQDDFMNIIYKFSDDEKYDDNRFQESKKIALTKLMNKEFTYYPNDTVITENNSTSDKKNRPFLYSYTEDTSWNTGLKLKVVGVLKPKEGRQYSSLSTGFFYTTKFTEKYLNDNYDSKVSTFIRDYLAENENATGYPSGCYERTILGYTQKVYYGIYYTFPLEHEGTRYENNYGYLGDSNSMVSLLSMFTGSSAMTSTTLTLNAVGGNKMPSGISFYPKSFDNKYLVTDYLDKWNSNETLIVNGKEITSEDRNSITYQDNLQVVISMVNNIIDIVTIALVCFTALSLVVSTVMIGIITYVSVMERIKEIGIIRALGGRKKDVSHLFNAETFIIGAMSGVFGIIITYIIQVVLNAVIHHLYPMITTIASLSPISAIIIIVVSILLTTIAGLLPSRSAAKKDPVVALRTE